MDTFNYRQYLAENNLGPYSKTDKVVEQNMDHDQEDVEHRNATSTDPRWMQENPYTTYNPFEDENLGEDVNPYEDSAVEALWIDVEATLLPIIQKLKDPEEAKRYAKDIANSMRYNMDGDAEEYDWDEEQYLEQFYKLTPLFYSEINSHRGGVIMAVARNLKYEPDHPELAEILRQFGRTFKQNN